MSMGRMPWARRVLVANAAVVSLGYGALAALVAVVYRSGSGLHLSAALLAFVVVFLTLLAIWSWLCRGAYRHLSSQGRQYKVTFWALVACNVVLVVFPVGLGFAVTLVFLRHAILRGAAAGA